MESRRGYTKRKRPKPKPVDQMTRQELESEMKSLTNPLRMMRKYVESLESGDLDKEEGQVRLGDLENRHSDIGWRLEEIAYEEGTKAND